jgi:hypothetical protein
LPETARRKRSVVEVITSDEQIIVVKKTEKSQALKTMGTIFIPMIVMLGDPTVMITTVYNTIIFACLYFLVSYLV